jgi:TolB-like protein
VLPFANLSSDPEQEYFSDGVADDIITELSRERALFVIARNSSFTYRGRSIDVKQVQRELGVRYVVEGSVRREAERVRVSAQLIDAATGDHVWAERYDRALEHVFAVQDEIADAVATAIRPAVGHAEQRRALRKAPGSLTAWETYQRGLWHLTKLTQSDNEQARSLFQQALEIDPGFALAYVRLAKTFSNDALFHGTRPIAEAVLLAEAEARKAVAIDPNDSEAQSAVGQEFFTAGDFGLALDRAERALALNRSSVSSHMLKGAILAYSGRCAEGRAEMSISLRLNPRDPWSHHAGAVIAASYYFDRNYTAAVETARRSLAEYPAFAAPCRYLVAGLGQLGWQDEAVASLRRWMATAPAVFDMMVRSRPPFVRPQDHEHLLDGMRKAGWQG